MNGFYGKIYFKIILTFSFILVFIVFALFSLDKIVEEKNELVSVHAEELILAQKLNNQISMLFAAMAGFIGSLILKNIKHKERSEKKRYDNCFKVSG